MLGSNSQNKNINEKILVIIELYRAKTLEDQVRLFWEQGDFGYIKKMKGQVLDLCQPNEPVIMIIYTYIVDRYMYFVITML